MTRIGPDTYDPWPDVEHRRVRGLSRLLVLRSGLSGAPPFARGNRHADPHLLIPRKTAVGLCPASELWTTRATGNLAVPLGRLRVDRRLEEALIRGADPLHLALVFGIDGNRHPLRGISTRASGSCC